MQQNSASFWADIKNYEELLAQDPDSFLFARLAEVYLKVNLIDDALHIARQGVARHPAYIAGQRALAMACLAKGLEDECRRTMETLADAIPEDREVQMLLGKLLAASGDSSAAARAFGTALVFYPADEECLAELKALESAAALKTEHAGGPYETDAEILFEEDEIIDLDESDIVEEYEPETVAEEFETVAAFKEFEPEAAAEEIETEAVDVDAVPEVTFAAPPAAEAVRHDPLSTATLAELYVQQGFIGKALDIYRAMYAEDFTNIRIRNRIAELVAMEAESLAVVDASDEVSEISESAETVSGITCQEYTALASVVPAQGEADAVIATLEGWLDTIRRIKACR